MCGLVGVFSHIALNSFEIDNFNNLLYCSALRGEDSTGVMLVTDKGVFDYYKAAVTPSEFICNQLPPLLDKHKGNILGLFGHTRLATTGKIKHANSHPFMVNKQILMMHNGNVTYAPKVEVKEYEVDSMALAHSLQRHEDPKEVFEGFTGAACVLWFDIRTKTFNVFRNSERPLAYYSNYATTYLASEKKMLEWLMSRSRNSGDVKEVESHKIYKYDVSDFKKTPEVVSVPFGSPRLTYGTGGTNTRYSGGRYDHYYHQRGSETADPPFRVTKKGKVISLPAPRKDPSEDDGTEALKIAAKESPIMLLREYGPFEIGDNILLCPTKFDEFKGEKKSSFRVELCPLCINWTDDYRNKFGNVKLYYHNYQEEKALEIYSSDIVDAQITNIRYDRSKESIDERLVCYVGNAKVHGVYNG